MIQHLYLLQLAATLFMTGLIWFVQIVHYPLFLRIPPAAFVPYERTHTTRTGWVVAPIMLLELITAAALLVLSAPLRHSTAFLTATTLLAAVWISTAVLQIPLHRRLSASPDPAAITSLIHTNWLRTIAWSLRSILLLATAPNAEIQLASLTIGQ